MIENNYINGAFQLVYIDYGEGYFPIGALTSNSFEESSDTITTTTRDNEGWETQQITNQNYTINFDGLVINTNYAKGDFEKISYDRLKIIKRDRQIIDWKIQDSNLQFIESGQAQITDLSSDGEIDEYVSFSCTMKGYGKPNSSSERAYILQDGRENNLQDGNNNNLITG